MEDASEETQERGFTYETVEEPPEDCLCILCELLVKDARQTECCGRIMCSYCIDQYKKNVMVFKCPNCRTLLQGKYFKDLRTDRAVQCLTIYCTRRSEGCDWQGKIEDIELHVRANCNQTYVECQACSKEMKRKFINEHLQDSCIKRHFACPHCGDSGSYEEITTTHLQVCLQVPLPCPVQGCDQRIKRCNLNEHLARCSKLVVCCPNHANGCETMIQREHMEEHCTICPKRHHICPYCKMEGSYDFISAEHTIECPEMRVTCHTPLCKEKIKQCDMKQHLQVCSKMVVNCPYDNIGCTGVMKREDLEKHEEKAMKNHLRLALNRLQLLENESKPTIVRLTNVSECKRKNTNWLSKEFYSSAGGYKARLNIYMNGVGEVKGKYVSVFIVLMPGKYDDTLEWPFQGEVVIELLNQITNSNHMTVTTVFDSETSDEVKDRKFDEDTTLGYGSQCFASIKELECPVYFNTQYLVNDTIYFRVTFRTSSLTKPWLAYQDD